MKIVEKIFEKRNEMPIWIVCRACLSPYVHMQLRLNPNTCVQCNDRNLNLVRATIFLIAVNLW